MKLHELINHFKNNKNFIIILKSVAAIALITAVAAISAHYLTGQTLSQYAEENPELAYSDASEEGASEPESISAEKKDISSPESISDISDKDEAELSDTISEASAKEKPSGSDSLSQADESGNENRSEEASGSPDNAQADSNDSEYISASKVSETASEKPTEASLQYDIYMSDMVHFYDMTATNASANSSQGRTVIAPGFYYEPLSNAVIDYITGSSMPTEIVNPAITYDDLSYVGLLYVGFDGTSQAGELICNKNLARDFAEIFYELYCADYQIQSVYLVDNYGADDTESMIANNTSCFNYRVVDDSTSLSNHAYGRAIDINPYYNPYIVFGAGENGSDYISPPGSGIYADRSQSFPYKIDSSDLCYQLFIEHGFTWGGNWNSCKDYQHFQKKN